MSGGVEYSEDNDDWDCIDPPTKSHRYLHLPENLQSETWESILDTSVNTLKELEREGALGKTLVRKAKALTTGFDDGDLVKIR